MDPLTENRSTLQKVQDLPRAAVYLVLASIEAYVVVNYFPNLAEGYSLRRLALIIYGVHMAVHIIWRTLLYNRFFSPMRTLPHPKEWITADGILFGSPRGVDCLRWMKEIPNDGLINTTDFSGDQFPLITSPQVYAEVLVHRSYDFVKPWLLRKFLSRILGWGVIVAEADVHQMQRRSLMPAFQLKNIRDLFPLMWDKSMLLTDILEKEIRAEPVDSGQEEKGVLATGHLEIGGWTSRLTLDIIGPAAMGRDFQSLQNNENLVANSYLELLTPDLRRLLFFTLALLVPPWVSENWPSPVNASIKRTMKEIRSVCADIISQKKQEIAVEKEESRQKDILSTMLRGKDLPDTVCVDQMLTFLAAGHETTANALTWTCLLLSKHPHYQSALREELREAIPDPTQPLTSADLEALPLLNGVCNEVLRLHPTVPITSRQPIKDVRLAGHRIPAGTWLILCPWATNRDPKLWGGDAEDFRPERWIDEASTTVVADGSGGEGTATTKTTTTKRRLNSHGGSSTNYAMMTFLHGPRSCIGQVFARAELRCALAALVGRFDIRLQRPDEEIVSVGSITAKPKGGLHLKMGVLEGWCVEPSR